MIRKKTQSFCAVTILAFLFLPPNTSKSQHAQFTTSELLLNDAETKIIASRNLLDVSAQVDCNVDGLKYIADQLTDVGNVDRYPFDDSDVSFIAKPSLTFRSGKLCRFSMLYNGVEIEQGDWSFFVSYDDKVRFFRSSSFDVPPEIRELQLTQSEAELLSISQVVDDLSFRNATSEEVSVDSSKLVYRRSESGTLALHWRVKIVGSYTNSEGEFRSLSRSLLVRDSDAQAEMAHDLVNNAYSWTCPYTSSIAWVRHTKHGGGTQIDMMYVVNPAYTYTGNYELVDYCGVHVYDEQESWTSCICEPWPCTYPILPFCLIPGYGYLIDNNQYFYSTTTSDMKNQDAYYWGNWVRDYYLDRDDYIDFGDYDHKFNIRVNSTGSSCCHSSIKYVRKETRTLPSMRLSFNAGIETVMHEYTHLVEDYVRPGGVFYDINDFDIYQKGFAETVSQSLEDTILMDAYRVETSPIPHPHWHFNPQNKYCEVFTEGLQGCTCDNQNNCILGTPGSGEHYVGRAFIQAFHEIAFNRRYTDESCSSDSNCQTKPNGHCDTQAVSGYCYYQIGNYSKEDAFEAFWFGVQNVDEELEDNDQFAALVYVFLYYMVDYNYNTRWNILSTFSNHDIDAL